MRRDNTGEAVLEVLKLGPATSTELAEATQLKASSISGWLTKGVKLGLVKWKPVVEGSKARLYSLNSNPPTDNELRVLREEEKEVRKGKQRGARAYGGGEVKEGEMAKVVWTRGKQVRLVTATGELIKGELV